MNTNTNTTSLGYAQHSFNPQEQWSKWQLFSMMIQRQFVVVRGVSGIINKIEVEDGGGHCFIVTMSNGDKVFVRSMD